MNIIELNQNEVTIVAGGGLWDWVSHVGAGCLIIAGAVSGAKGINYARKNLLDIVTGKKGFDVTSNVILQIFGGLGMLYLGMDHFIKLGSSKSVDEQATNE